MRSMNVFSSLVAVVVFLVSANGAAAPAEQPDYHDLLTLFAEWREFESPPMTDGAPDYTVQQFVARRDDFEALRARLQSFDIDDWPVPQQVDWHLVRAEMNGYISMSASCNRGHAILLSTIRSGPIAATCRVTRVRPITPWLSYGPTTSR